MESPWGHPIADGYVQTATQPVGIAYKAYKGWLVDCGYRIDVLVEGRILVELKVVDSLLPVHSAASVWGGPHGSRRYHGDRPRRAVGAASADSAARSAEPSPDPIGGRFQGHPCPYPSAGSSAKLHAVRKVYRRAWAGFGMVLTLGCSSSQSAPTASPDASRGDAESEASRIDAGSDAPSADPYNGNCKTARWDNVSDACWSCYCAKCETQLNHCTAGCIAGFQCGEDNHVAVGVEGDLACEGRAFDALCLPKPAIMAAYNQIYAFDVCLITSHDPATDMLRACEVECGTTYTGDVCQRFPPPDAGDDAGTGDAGDGG